MFNLDRRVILHFDFVLIALAIPLILMSGFLIDEISPMLSKKHTIYTIVGMVVFVIVFFIPIRKYKWLIPLFYWLNIALLFGVEFFGVSKLGAKRWIEIPFINFTIQPSETIKPFFLLMMAYLIQKNPPPKNGYSLKRFLILSFYILLPFMLIAKEPDLGTALTLLLVGNFILFIIGVNWKIWAIIFISISLLAPFLYSNLHPYQKKRIEDFISKKPSYHVQQSIIAIGSGGILGKDKDLATQTQLKFLPIASSDFIFAYATERFGFLGAFFIMLLYALIIFHLSTLNNLEKDDYYIRVISLGLCFMIYIYASVNIAMTIGLAPVVGLPLPFFSYGGSSFMNFVIICAILQNLLAFRFNFMYNTPRKWDA